MGYQFLHEQYLANEFEGYNFFSIMESLESLCNP